VAVERGRENVLERLAALEYPLLIDGITVTRGRAARTRYDHHVFAFSLADVVGEREIRSDAAQRLDAAVRVLYRRVADAFGVD